MDVVAMAAEALKPISESGIIVQQGWYDAELNTIHVTLWKMRDFSAAHSDDGCEVEAASIQINIWSKEDQQDLVKKIKKLMKAYGFQFTEGNDQTETDTGLFVNAMRFVIIREAEEDKEE